MGKGKGTTAIVYETVPMSSLFVPHKPWDLEEPLEDKEKGEVLIEEIQTEIPITPEIVVESQEMLEFFDEEDENDDHFLVEEDTRADLAERLLLNRKLNSYSRVTKDKKHEKVNPDRFVRSWKQAQEVRKESRIIQNYPKNIRGFNNFGYHRGDALNPTSGNINWKPATDREAEELNRAIIESATMYSQTMEVGLSQQQIQDMLSRDLTPEDYELLLMLDKSIAPKTVEETKLSSFTSRVVDDSPEFKDRCAVCMCDYEEGESVLVLPCKHLFHKDCIEQWLTKSSKNCPIDNLPV